MGDRFRVIWRKERRHKRKKLVGAADIFSYLRQGNQSVIPKCVIATLFHSMADGTHVCPEGRCPGTRMVLGSWRKHIEDASKHVLFAMLSSLCLITVVMCCFSAVLFHTV